MSIEDIQVPLGSLFVFLHSVHRFNTPPTNRASTTAGRYWWATATYCALLVGLYLALVFAPVLIELATTGGEVAQQLPEGSPALLVALCLTVLLPTLPVLKDMDEWVREALRELAAIPHEARRLRAEILRAPFALSPRMQQRVFEELARDLFDPGDLVSQPAATPHSEWVKLTALMIHLHDWESDRRFAGFLSTFGDGYRDLTRRYRLLVPKTRNWFKTVRELQVDEGGRIAEVAAQYQAELAEQHSGLLLEVVTFISHGLLKCELTYASRTARLRSIGFDLVVHPSRLTMNRVMTLFGAVGLVFVGGFVLVDSVVTGGTGPGIGQVLIRTVSIAVIYTAAVCCAIIPKESWAWARRPPDGDRPVASYFLAGIEAAAISLVVTFLMGLAMNTLDFPKALQSFSVRYPWTVMSFVTAFVTAWLADDPPAERGARARTRIVEGLTQACINVAAVSLVRLWLAELAKQSGNVNVPLPNWVSLILMTSVIGFLIGYLVPTWYREAPRESEDVKLAAVRKETPQAVSA